MLIWCVVAIAVSVFSGPPKSRDPDYMVAITGVTGLDDLASATGDEPSLSPVFNLTVRIDNSGNTLHRACVYGLSTAVVSYGDAFLGKGSVPQFCAEKEEVQERAATAWGQGVVAPEFLRERLAGEMKRGEAAVDVQVTTPADCYKCSDNVLVCSKVKIGGDPAPCRREDIYRVQRQPLDPMITH
ncbi:hypothetical protein HU200_031662 [Digitaria exilis]|uniref:Uncharacterized protein n=1 Tax=Digitaria exilis TaxID=1010633 RepID=A0A835BMD8_9POAL|nr:hypothetical protein HU200_031662 [Digitaria exilis]CAB3485079.1 unnamed protein product [Digitaria exilis]